MIVILFLTFSATLFCLQKASPFLDASFPNRLFFTWLTPLIWKGYRKPVEQTDLFDLTEENTSEHVVHIWNQNWEKSLDKASK